MGITYPFQLWSTAFFSLLGALQFGLHLGIVNTGLFYVCSDLQVSKEGGGATIVTMLSIGACLGALLAGTSADLIGPGKALLWNNVLFLVGTLASAISPEIIGMVVGRFLCGVACGAASLITPRFLAEIAPVSIRGAFGTCNQLFVTIGCLVGYLLGLPYDSKTPVHVQIGAYSIPWWRVMFASCALPALLQMVGMAISPESPIWLEWKGKWEACNISHLILVGTPAPMDEQDPALQSDEDDLLIDDGDRDFEEDEAMQGEASWGELFKRRYSRMMLLAGGLPLLQQFSGINTVIFYSTDVFFDAGMTSPVLGSIIMGSVNVIGTLLAVFLMDHFGRRPLLLFSHAAMSACLFVTFAVILLPVSSAVASSITLTSILLFVGCFSQGVGPIPWVYLSEILPPRIKGRAASLCVCGNWICVVIVGQTFPPLLKLLGTAKAYLIYAIFNLVAVGFVWAFMVETKQKNMRQIKNLLLVKDR